MEERYRVYAAYLIILLCILSFELFFDFDLAQGIWLIVILSVLVALIGILPSSVFRRLEHTVGYVVRAPQRYRQRRRANLHEEERLYEQGYQAVSSNAAQQPVTVQDLAEPYEAPQAQYPQQQTPMQHQ